LSGELKVERELEIEEIASQFTLLRGSRSRRSHRSRVVMVMMDVMMMMMVMMVMMVMMMMHRRFGVHRRRSGRGAGDCLLGDGVSGEAEREHGRGRKGLDHGRSFLWLGNPKGSQRSIKVAA
jgi:hypothetical protein